MKSHLRHPVPEGSIAGVQKMVHGQKGVARLGEISRFADTGEAMFQQTDPAGRPLPEFLIVMAIIVYGIKNCNTVKSALAWLKDNDVEYEFHDFKTKGISSAKLKEWCAQVGWEALVNKRGTTWRQLSSDVQEKIKNQTSAIALMREKTSVIKRPVIELSDKVILLGFDPGEYAKKF